MIENPPDDAQTADERWLVTSRGDAIKQPWHNSIKWRTLMLINGDCIARFGRRWFLFRGRAGVREVVEFQTKEAALLAWRIMK